MVAETKTALLITCNWCKSPHEVKVLPSDLDKWRSGTLAQHAFPYLTPDERELLISRTCSKCWEEMFKEPGQGDSVTSWPDTDKELDTD